LAKICTQCGYKFRGIGSMGQKWCPKCGTVNKIEAKVCTSCGHRFRTVFTQGAAPAAPAEPPISQPLPDAIELPPVFEQPPQLPPRPAAPAIPDAAAPDPTPTPIDLRGATRVEDESSALPAPDLTDLDFDSLRRTKKPPLR
jgi:hypothetical protein